MGSACGSCRSAEVVHVEEVSRRPLPPAQSEREERKRRLNAYRDSVFQQTEFERRLQTSWQNEGLHKVMTLCEYLPFGVVMFTEDGFLGFVNDHILLMAGRDKEGVRAGNHLSKIIDLPERIDLEELCYRENSQYHLQHALGVQLPVVMYTVPLEVAVRTPEEDCIPGSPMSSLMDSPARRNSYEHPTDPPMVLVAFISSAEDNTPSMMRSAERVLASARPQPPPHPEYDGPMPHVPTSSSQSSPSSVASDAPRVPEDALDPATGSASASTSEAASSPRLPGGKLSPVASPPALLAGRKVPPRLALGDLVSPASNFPPMRLIKSPRCITSSTPRYSVKGGEGELVSLGAGSPTSNLSGNLRRMSSAPLSSPRGSIGSKTDCIATLAGLGDIMMVFDPQQKVLTHASLAAQHLLGITDITSVPYLAVLHASEHGEGSTLDTLTRLLKDTDDAPDRVCFVTDPGTREGLTVLVSSVMHTSPNTAVVRFSTMPNKARGIRFKRDSGLPEELASLVDALTDATLVTTLSGQILHHNTTFGVMFECDIEDVINKDVSLFVPQPLQRSHMDHVRRLHNVKNRAQRKYLKRHRAVVGQTLRGTAVPIDITVTEMVFSKETVFYVATMRRILTHTALSKYHHQSVSLMHQIGAQPPADFSQPPIAVDLPPLSSSSRSRRNTDTGSIGDSASEPVSPSNSRGALDPVRELRRLAQEVGYTSPITGGSLNDSFRRRNPLPPINEG